jgi:DNA-binding NarL/FixJ family response regulator
MQPNDLKARVALVEDHPMFREQLRHLINQQRDMMVCAEADSAQSGFEAIRANKPSLAIIDLSLKNSSGLELLKDLRAQDFELPVLVLSMHDESLYAERALRAGANGYITKQEASEEVMEAIRQVLAGEIYLDPKFMKRVVRKIFKEGTDNSAISVDRLTDRELAVFELIGEGKTAREIAVRLRIGTTTLDTYRARIKEKLGFENGAQLRTNATLWLQERHTSIPHGLAEVAL